MSERGFMTNRAIEAAARRAEENRGAMSERSDYAKRLAEIEDTPVVNLSWGDACEQRGWLLAQLRAASDALAALGVPDNGRPLAERIEALGDDPEILEAIRRCRDGEHRKGGEYSGNSCADCGVDFGDLDTEDEPITGRSSDECPEQPEGFPSAGIRCASSIEDAIAIARETDPVNEPVVIGGAEIYRAALPHVTRIYLTEIDRDVEGDTVFHLDRTGFSEVERRAGEESGVSFVVLERERAAVPPPDAAVDEPATADALGLTPETLEDG